MGLRVNELRNRVIDKITTTLNKAKHTPKKGPSKRLTKMLDDINLTDAEKMKALKWLDKRVSEIEAMKEADNA